MSWEITGNAGTHFATNFLGTTDDQPLIIKTNGVETMWLYSVPQAGGAVTIGDRQSGPVTLTLGTGASYSSIQSEKIGGGGLADLRINPSFGNVVIGQTFGLNLNLSATLTVIPLPPGGGIVIGQPDITQGGFTSLSLSISDTSDGHAVIQAIKSSGFAYGDLVLNPDGGNVGVGTTAPSAKLTVDPQGAGGIVIGNPSITQGGFTSLQLDISAASGGHARVQAIKSAGSAYGDLVLNPDGGNVGVGTISPGAKLEVNGHVKVTVLEIVGGADLAEPFSVEDSLEVEPGTVMVIDENRPGNLKISNSAYDRKVAGIVSGANGISTGLTLQHTSLSVGKTLVALAGRLYCKAEALSNSIQPGDLLTTSSLPGYAMKSTDSSSSHGAIIGKAMTTLLEGTGFVLVLVNLQ